MIDQTSSTKVENVIPNLSDLVAATFLPVGRQGGCVTYVDSSSNEKRRLKPAAATTACNIKSLNLGYSNY